MARSSPQSPPNVSIPVNRGTASRRAAWEFQFRFLPRFNPRKPGYCLKTYVFPVSVSLISGFNPRKPGYCLKTGNYVLSLNGTNSFNPRKPGYCLKTQNNINDF